VLYRSLESIPHAAECKRLFVLPEFRGRSIASHLMDAIEDAARAAGLRWLYLDSKDDFQAAIAMYRRRLRECERYNDNPEPQSFSASASAIDVQTSRRIDRDGPQKVAATRYTGLPDTFAKSINPLAGPCTAASHWTLSPTSSPSSPRITRPSNGDGSREHTRPFRSRP